jgi:hypothetical protein
MDATHVPKAKASDFNIASKTGFRKINIEPKNELPHSRINHDHGAPVSIIRIQYSLIYHPQIHTP